MIDLWVDDERSAPEDWLLVDTNAAAIDVLRELPVRHLSLDYSLGDGETTDAIMYWLRDNPHCWPSGNIVCHSSSSSAQRLIEFMVTDFAPAG